MTLKSITSSRKVINLINKFGHCCSYNVIEELETEATFSECNSVNISPEGAILTPNLCTGVAFDNCDRYVETCTGKDSLHETVGILYQNIQTDDDYTPRGSNDNVEPPVHKKRRTFDAIIPELSQYVKKPSFREKLLPINSELRVITSDRYLCKGQPVERFWRFYVPDGHDAKSIAACVLNVVNPLLDQNPNKLIAQSYDGASVISVYENRKDLIEVMDNIESTSCDSSSINQASGYKLKLQDTNFVFWLSIFHKIMPHVEIVFNQLQKVCTDSVKVKNDLENFEAAIQTIREQMDSIIDEIERVQRETDEPARKKGKLKKAAKNGKR
ncbi:unnamed protein product [Acanthoscelides obtectus]|uniref:Uncharacterized protein n=1 Tax=Acanthoscelides obtectus TaxID=200917 RepID=A0A9P0JX53_ACAOB|nr:unnamed protein product [Acanthoscelides obtectus]CAK1640669.1 hypothetical protein AOBTE_LOCUS11860 [Acanthoscelides obtectus]